MVKNKKHICVIVSCLLAVMVAITPLLTAKRQETTVEAATSITSSNPYIVFPSVTLNYLNVDYVFPSLYLTFHNGLGGDGFHSDFFVLYFCDSSDVDSYSTGYYEELNLYQAFVHYSDFMPFKYCEDNGNIKFTPLAGKGLEVYYSSDYSFEQIISLANGVSYNTYGDNSTDNPAVLGFDIINTVNNSTLFSLTFINTYAYKSRNPSIYFISPILYNVSNKDFADHIYDNGYTRGYSKGYKVGYDLGLNKTWGQLSPWQAILNGIDDFVSAPLFGNISLKLLFLVAFGCILFGLFIKTFFH